MDRYISNITSLKRTENNISFTFKETLYYLTLNITENSITLQLREENSVMNYIGTMLLSDMKKEKLLSHCESIKQLKEALYKIISKGRIIFEPNKDNTNKLTLFGKILGEIFSVDIILREEETLNDENIINRIDEKLKTLPTLVEVENKLKQYHNAVNESMKINNNEVSALREEIKLQFREHSESRLKAIEENIFKAVKEFDNYKLQIDSFDSFVNKMNLYKDVLMNLEDDKISNLLKERFCCLYNVMSNEFRIHYKNVKETLTEQKAKEEHLSQTIKELKDEIIRQSSKEDNLIQTIKELK
jgi:hypothetical protein